MTDKISPLAPASYPCLPEIAGVRLAVAEAGIRYKNRPDILLVELAEGTRAAGVFTTSRTAAAPVTWCREILAEGKARALVVNSGNANAFTGSKGFEAVHAISGSTAKALDIAPNEVYIASTGVIGEPLQHEKITSALPVLSAKLSSLNWEGAARAIMTTDTFMKVATRSIMIDGNVVTINGFAKGSGMIAPDMATMLGFVFTDAAISHLVLQQLVEESSQSSFNSITVDGDTSTNDTLLVFATGKAGNAPIDSISDRELKPFKNALQELMLDLALQIVKDGEGANKLVTITVRGAENDKAAHTIAMTIANSPLVKTAIAGEDANWGRIVGAAGRAGERLEQEKLSVTIGGVVVAREGMRVENYDEIPVTAHMKGNSIEIEVDIQLGKGFATVYTCDLTHGYIDINGSYRS